ncbi:MAG: YggT family protein [Actinomycetota bacterium]|nr:YggT family protein [Actinomycetota bacterium]
MPFYIFNIIDIIFRLLYILILVRVVLSFLPIPVNKITRPILNFIYDITEPILRLVRNILPPIMIGGIGLDLSPIIAIILLNIIHTIIISVLRLFIG